MILSPDKAVQDSIHYLQSYLQENNDGAGNSEDSTNDAKTGARVARTGTSEPPAASSAAPWMFPPEPSTATQRDPAPRTPHRRTTARASATTSTTTLSARGDVEGSFTETVNHLRQSWRTPDSPHRPRHHPFSPQCRRPINRPAYSMDSTPNHRLRSGAVPLFSHDDAAARWSLPSAIARPSVSLGSTAAYAASPLLSRPTHADPFRRVPVLRYSHSRSPLREVYPPSLSRRSSLPLGYSDAVAPPIMGRPPRVVPATSPPSMAVQETPVRARRHGAPPPPQPDSPSPSPRRAAPSLPLREEDANPPHTHDSFDVHDRSLSTIAEYLKNYYACDVDEPTKCVETLMPDDVLNLAQCFYVDLYRRVRSRRDVAGMDTSSFVDAEPQVHDVERSVPRYPADSLEPPPPPPPPLSTESGHNRRKIPLGKPSSNATNARDSEQDVCSPSPPANSRGTDSSQRIEAVLPVFVKPFDHSPSPSAPSPSGASKHPSLSHPPPTDDYSRQVVACCPSPPYGVWGGRPTTTEVSTDDVFRHRRATPAAPSPSSTKPVVPPSSIKPAAVPAATRAATPPDSSGRRHVMILDGRRTPSDRESSVVSHRTQTPQDPRTHSTLSSSGSPRRPGRRGSANDVRILKRPLRELMPLLRRGTVLCRYSDDDHAPEARFFRVDDRRAMFHHKEVLMPHLVWAAIPKDLPQSLHALNLTDLIGVSVGPSVHTHPSRPWYHRRGSRTVVNDRDEAVPLPWCCILQFRQQSIAVAFYNEEDRQTWVGAMMGVVERNRELGM